MIATGPFPMILAAIALALVPSITTAQIPKECVAGQSVVDNSGKVATVAAGRDEECLIKYKDGHTLRWVARKELAAAQTITPPLVKQQAATNAASEDTRGVTVVRPKIVNRLVYDADALGHVVLNATVNGAPVRFLVDTGATLVSLSPEDASAAGLKRGDLTFDHVVHTGNGPVKAAFVRLREIRIDQLRIENVQAAVIDSLKQSVLGMSFLNQLKEFEFRNGVLTMSW